MTEALVSAPEILKKILDDDDQVPTSAPGGVIVGPASTAQQKEGAIVLAEAGIARLERDIPLIKMALTARCIAGSVDRAERISAVLYDALHRQGRRVVLQESSSQSFLVHYTQITGGPTLTAGEIEDTWEQVLTVEIMIGTEPVV